MTPDNIITKAYLHALRKPTPPNSGTTKYNALLAIVDSMQRMWANEPGTEWNSLYRQLTLTTTANGGTSYALTNTAGSTVDHLSKRETDPVLVGTRPFKLVKPNQLYKYKDQDKVAIMGGQLVFSKALDASLTGASIVVPAYITVPTVNSGSDATQIVVDDPMWLVYATAAEFDRNDIVKVSQYGNLLTLADQSMQRMKMENGGGHDEVDTPTGWMMGESWI